ncbi:MAG: phosphoribosylglycinamide formyltransferase [Tissierellia bacterium]|nr:phosphoribosylglycinamide formyltransferase [Tissierellia bacterium]
MESKRIAVLISGSGSNLQSLIDAQKNRFFNGEICLVVSNRKSAYGLERARLNNIRSINISIAQYPTVQEFDNFLLQILEEEKIDLIVLAGYLRFVSDIIVKKFKNRIVNIHPSLLPSFGGEGYYGIRVHEAVIERGCKLSGATVHFVDESHDTGPIIFQKAIEVCQDWDAEELQRQVLKIEHEILPLAVKYYCDDKLLVKDHRVYIKE